MRGIGVHIYAQYFEFRSAGTHLESCSLAGTNMWEVTRFRRTGLHDEVLETVLRLACHECGQVMLEGSEGDTSFEHTDADYLGYASKPQKVRGLWLWPGPRIFYGDATGPTAFYVTTTRTMPREPADVAGVVGWHLSKRRAVRWSAGLGCREHGGVFTDSGVEHHSKTAAVAWISEQLATTAG